MTDLENNVENIKYEVQHYTLCDGWINTWSIYDENDNPIPSVFDTKEEAQAELDDFFEDIQTDIDSGFRDKDHGYGRDEFRIVPILKGAENEQVPRN